MSKQVECSPFKPGQTGRNHFSSLGFHHNLAFTHQVSVTKLEMEISIVRSYLQQPFQAQPAVFYP
jgi:hypothetical protein